ncbi:hypothetical protein GMRT_11433 [Giardia muris]|uniref:Uncharacterized protein n=1 Tax=Giardia muris TaxID=5742 RepID=A0A4Z1T713_GIAMU|nr:hypothetical protein GMRT_11433 [Giardia muris]|eukprot:TNJ28291.1 hypothetical protein GMRT_11433 [Giardia muris]
MYARYVAPLRSMSEAEYLHALELEAPHALALALEGRIADVKGRCQMRTALLKLALARRLGLREGEQAIHMAASLLAKSELADKASALALLESVEPAIEVWERLLLNSFSRELQRISTPSSVALVLAFLGSSMPHTETLIEALVPDVLALIKDGAPQTLVPAYAFLACLLDTPCDFMRASTAEALATLMHDLTLVGRTSYSWRILRVSVIFVSRVMDSPYADLVSQDLANAICKAWANIVSGNWPHGPCDYHGILDPFLQISLLRLLGCLCSRMDTQTQGHLAGTILTYLQQERRVVRAYGHQDEHYSNMRAAILLECGAALFRCPALQSTTLLEQMLPRITYMVSSRQGRRSLALGLNALTLALQQRFRLDCVSYTIKSSIVPYVLQLPTIQDDVVALNACRCILALAQRGYLSIQSAVTLITEASDRFDFPYESRALIYNQLLEEIVRTLPTTPERATVMLLHVLSRTGFVSDTWLRRTADACFDALNADRARLPQAITALAQAMKRYRAYAGELLVLLLFGRFFYEAVDVFLTSTANFVGIDSVRVAFLELATTYTDTHPERQALIRSGFASLSFLILSLNSVSLEPIRSMARILEDALPEYYVLELHQLLEGAKSSHEVFTTLQGRIGYFGAHPYGPIEVA